MGNLLKLSYWFSPVPGPFLDSSLKVVYAFFGLLVIFGLIAWLFAGKNKDNRLIYKFWQKVQMACLTIGIVGLLLIFFRQQRITVLGMPFLLALNILGGLVWMYFIVRYIIKKVPEKKKEIEMQKEKEKYLPK